MGLDERTSKAEARPFKGAQLTTQDIQPQPSHSQDQAKPSRFAQRHTHTVSSRANDACRKSVMGVAKKDARRAGVASSDQRPDGQEQRRELKRVTVNGLESMRWRCTFV